MALEERDIEAAALQLDLRSRARLAEKLLASLEGNSDDEVVALWVEEAHQRDLDMDSGVDIGRPADEVLREARQRLK